MTGDLQRLLLDSRACLLRGDIEGLGALAVQIEAALTDFRPASAAEAQGLRDLALRNTGCLAAAMAGVRAAQRRLAEIQPGATLATYDSGGRRIGRSTAEVAWTRRL